MDRENDSGKWAGSDEDDLSALAGGRAALDRLFSLTYEELRRLAAGVRRHVPSSTLSPTTLVNEAWLKLSRSPEVAGLPELHFKRLAARAMRQILISAARRRAASKRGGVDNAYLITFDETLQSPVETDDELVALDDALNRLASVSPRQAAMVESRFFGGLEIPEIAAWLNVSEATVLRDWRAAKAWLASQIRTTGKA